MGYKSYPLLSNGMIILVTRRKKRKLFINLREIFMIFFDTKYSIFVLLHNPHSCIYRLPYANSKRAVFCILCATTWDRRGNFWSTFSMIINNNNKTNNCAHIVVCFGYAALTIHYALSVDTHISSHLFIALTLTGTCAFK